MSSVIILALVLLGYTNARFEGKCRCYEEPRLIDCTAVGLYSMPHSKSTQDNYTSILLRENYLKHLNFSSLFKVLPRVVLLDPHDNNPLLCHDIMRFQHSKSIKIISDCKNSTTEITTYSTSEIPATHQTKTRTHKPSFPSSAPSISETVKVTAHLPTQISRMETSNQVIFYIYSLIASLVILTTTAILSRLIIRCWKLRQRTHPVMLHLLPLKIKGDEEDNQSKEDAIFTQTTEL